jgi:hypothetical protein
MMRTPLCIIMTHPHIRLIKLNHQCLSSSALPSVTAKLDQGNSAVDRISRCLTIDFTDSRAILNIFDTKAIVIATRQNPTNYPRTLLLGCC